MTTEHRNEPYRHDHEAGFSLVELMLVVFIMGLLGFVIYQNFAPISDQSRVSKARTDIRTLESALEQYSLDMFGYPTQAEGLSALQVVPAGADAGNYRPGGYIRRLPNDPWNHPYQYVRPAQKSSAQYDVFSFGADGQPGGEGLDADIGNWE